MKEGNAFNKITDDPDEDLNTTFDEANKVLKSGTKDNNLNETMNNLRDITDILSSIYFDTDLSTEKSSEEKSDTFAA